MGPMFRYERPQKGRYRQFHQLDVEALGFPGPDVDAELILMTARLWRRLGPARPAAEPQFARHAGIARRVSRASSSTISSAHAGVARRGQPAPARRQSAAHPRQQESGDGRRHRGRAVDHRPPRPGIGGAFRDAVRAPDARRASISSSIHGWCAGSTTIRAPCSSGSRPTSARRTPCARAAVTTVSSRNSAASRRRPSAGRWARSASSN